MIDAQESTKAEMPISKCIHDIPRTNSDVVCELAVERREVSWKLDMLKKAVEADPQSVSAHHKYLWVKQVNVMQAYVDVLGDRIKDLIDSDT